MTRVITFGTFDLFHKGHENIFNICQKMSSNIVVGVSSDKFTHIKKNIYPVDDYDTRKQKICNFCKQQVVVFSEEKMELKNEYIQKYEANLLLMGDDWEGKFNFVDCAVIYPKRTEGISSTMLRAKLIKDRIA